MQSTNNQIKYDSTFNKTSLGAFTNNELNVLMIILSLMTKENMNKHCYKIEISFSEIRKMLGSPNLHISRIIKIYDSLSNIKCDFYNEHGIVTKDTLFSEYKLSSNKKIVTITLSKSLSDKFIVM